MDAFIVRGGRPLSGTVPVNGAKNSALKLVAAALLAEGRSTVHNVPAIADLAVMKSVLEHLGATVTRDGDGCAIDVPAEIECTTPATLAQQLRASIVVLGPLLARCGRARVAMPGGDKIGSRNIDMHLSGLARMGARIEQGPEGLVAEAERLVGTDIDLPYASVGATENLLLAAVTAAGTTRLANAAREPEVADVAAFLSRMGADISGAGTSVLEIRGVEALHPAEHAVVGDRIEAGTFAVAAAITDGEVRLTDVDPAHLRLPLERLRRAGVEVHAGERELLVRGTGDLRRVDIATLPYPGFPTDLQPQFLALLSQASGSSMVTENVFDGRFTIVPELQRMGADVELLGHHAIVRGPRRLRGAQVRGNDVRAGAALVLAGLAADGETVVTEANHVDRGYADFAARLRALGADVQRRALDRAETDAGVAAGAA